MLSKLFHEIIDVMHSRGLIDAGKQADLKKLVGEVVTAAEDTEVVAADAAAAGVPDAKAVEVVAADVAKAGKSVEKRIPDGPKAA
jgi:hypothetical protein